MVRDYENDEGRFSEIMNEQANSIRNHSGRHMR